MVDSAEIALNEVNKFMDDFIDRVFLLSQQKLIDDQKIDTGNLLKSGNVNRKFLNKEIVYAAPYADIIEFGRHPGTMPPPNVLHKWVRRKLGISKESVFLKKVKLKVFLMLLLWQ